MERTQIYLTRKESDALDIAARETRLSRSELIRQAIDARYGSRFDRERAEQALLRSAGAWKGRARSEKDGAAYVERVRSGRLAKLHGGRTRAAR